MSHLRLLALPALLFLSVACIQSDNSGGNADCEGKCDGFDDNDEPAADIGNEVYESWTFMQSHLHTTGFHACANNPIDPGPLPEGECYSSEGIVEFLKQALYRYASDVIITDHNNIDAWFDPAFRPMASDNGVMYATPLRGIEWSSANGHMTLMFPSEVVSSNANALSRGLIFHRGNKAEVFTTQTYLDVISAVHDEGGVTVMNHPELLIHLAPEDSLGVDGVEVGIPPNPLNDNDGLATDLQSSRAARAWWHRRLMSGDRLTGMAGADHHHGSGDIPGLEAPMFGLAVNLIRVDPSLPNYESAADALANPDTTIDRRSEIVADAIRRGHLMVVEDEFAARVYMGVDLDGDGRFHDARAGDCVLPQDVQGGTIPIRVRITRPSDAPFSSHYNALFWTGDDEDEPAFKVEVDYEDGFEESNHYDIDENDPFAITLHMPYDPRVRQFVRIVLERDVLGPYNDTEAVTNPIYLGDWGAQCDTAKVQR